MPIEIKQFSDLVWIELYGDVTPGDFFAYASQISAIDRESEISHNRFTDTSAATSYPGYSAVSDLAALRAEAKLKNEVKSAIYAANDLQFAMARMFEGMNTHPQIKIRVFRDKSAALEWVGWSGLPPDSPQLLAEAQSA